MNGQRKSISVPMNNRLDGNKNLHSNICLALRISRIFANKLKEQSISHILFQVKWIAHMDLLSKMMGHLPLFLSITFLIGHMSYIYIYIYKYIYVTTPTSKWHYKSRNRNENRKYENIYERPYWFDQQHCKNRKKNTKHTASCVRSMPSRKT